MGNLFRRHQREYTDSSFCYKLNVCRLSKKCEPLLWLRPNDSAMSYYVYKRVNCSYCQKQIYKSKNVQQLYVQ